MASPKYLNKITVKDLLDANRNRFFTVVFDTKDGETKTYNGRLRVVKGVKGDKQGKAVSNGLAKAGMIPLKIKGGYRAFSADRVRELRMGTISIGR
jgi:hypothetical protein